MTLLAGVRKGALGLVWFFKGVLGEDAYEKYVAHHAALHAADAASDAAGVSHPRHPLLTEREFWRDYTDRQDQNPQGRCC
jgi:uncharacterized short protein YbdD (DUF466 family)